MMQSAQQAPGPRPEQQRDTRLRFEQWAKNPTCQANTISAVHNIKMAQVAQRGGIKPSFGASPFALFRGEQFERTLLANGGERLIPELVDRGVLPAGASGLLDLRIRMNRGTNPSLRTLDAACDETLNALRTIGAARGDEVSTLESVVSSATLKLPRGVMLPEALLIIDLLAIHPHPERDCAEMVVGEIKTYPDRGGHTDRMQLAQARAQMGLYLHALQALTAALPKNERPCFSSSGFLVLTRPGSDFPRVRANEDLRFQADRAARGFDLLEAAAALLPPTPDADHSARLDTVLQADTHYSEACLSFCDLVPKCHGEALTREDPVVLGEDVRRFVAGIRLERIGQLLDGTAPSDDTERDLVDRIHAAENPQWD